MLRVVLACLVGIALARNARDVISQSRHKGEVQEPSCVDSQGRAVAWWFLYKTPKDSSASWPRNEGGYYVESTSLDPYMRDGIVSLGDAESPLSRTTLPLFEDDLIAREDTAFLMFSDQPPDRDAPSTRGHVKGYTMFGDTQGFLVSHSAPRFPPRRPGPYAYGAVDYGQSFMCVTVGVDELESMLHEMRRNFPFVYDHFLPEHLKKKVPSAKLLVESQHLREEPYWGDVQVSLALPSENVPTEAETTTSLRKLQRLIRGGNSLPRGSNKPVARLVSRSSKGGQDLMFYEDVLVSVFQQSLLTQTWRNGSGGKMPSFCPVPSLQQMFQVENIETVRLPAHLGDTGDISWRFTKDHAKWTVSTSDAAVSEHWVCSCDVNRMLSQLKRGGGCLCVDDVALHRQMQRLIDSVESCTDA
ncbi:MAG: hypothetical protein MHM6MM_003891 [Cercozoa sp. M6MM]